MRNEQECKATPNLNRSHRGVGMSKDDGKIEIRHEQIPVYTRSQRPLSARLAETCARRSNGSGKLPGVPDQDRTAELPAHSRPLSARLQDRLQSLPPKEEEENEDEYQGCYELKAEMEYLQKVIVEPALKFCGKCQTFKPNKPPFFRPTESICRFCKRK